MQIAPVARVLAGFATFFSFAQLVPLAHALLAEDDHAPQLIPAAGFAASIAVGSTTAMLLWLAGRGPRSPLFRLDGIAVVGLAWVLACALGAIPFVWSGAIPGAIDAVFETVSGLTTTGASVLGSGGNFTVEEMPASILLWRSLLQWMGGIGIVLVFVTLLPAMGVTGKSLIASEQIQLGSDGFQPRVLLQARLLFVVYTTLTAMCAALLWLLGGLGAFDAINHAMTALATGGFSTQNGSVAEFRSLPAEVVLTVFMFVAGCNAALIVAALQRGVRVLLRDTELRVYLLLTLGLVAIATTGLMADGRSFGAALRGASFNVVSVYTSTGFASEDFQTWSLPTSMLLIASMVIGACTGSTAGGIKVIRFVVVCKLMGYTVRHYLRPKSVERIKILGEPLGAAVISGILALVLMWCAGLFLGALAIALDDRIPFLTAISTAASMLGCCGPAICQVDAMGHAVGPDLGPLGGYGDLLAPTKLVLSSLMLLGRLEFLAPIALVSHLLARR